LVSKKTMATTVDRRVAIVFLICSALVAFMTLTDALRSSAHPMLLRFERFLPTTPLTQISEEEKGCSCHGTVERVDSNCSIPPPNPFYISINDPVLSGTRFYFLKRLSLSYFCCAEIHISFGRCSLKIS
jgi:hypothetical protein